MVDIRKYGKVFITDDYSAEITDGLARWCYKHGYNERLDYWLSKDMNVDGKFDIREVDRSLFYYTLNYFGSNLPIKLCDSEAFCTDDEYIEVETYNVWNSTMWELISGMCDAEFDGFDESDIPSNLFVSFLEEAFDRTRLEFMDGKYKYDNPFIRVCHHIMWYNSYYLDGGCDPFNETTGTITIWYDYWYDNDSSIDWLPVGEKKNRY